MRVAITGPTGFVGSHALVELQGLSVEVLAAVRSSAAFSSTPGWESVEHVELDISNPSSQALDRLAACDVLIHLAWGGLPNYKSRHHFASDLPKQYAFLSALVERGLRKLVVAGTCFEYRQQAGELSEDHLARPTNPYGFGKDSLRTQLDFLRNDFPLSLTWSRLFYCYGEGQPASSLYPQLMAAVARRDATFNMSGGEQLRDFLPVGEVARLLVALAVARAYACVVNVCSGRPISVRRLVEQWVSESGTRIQLKLGHYAYPDYEPLAFWGSRRKLDTVLERYEAS